MRKPPRELLERISRLERQQAHLQNIGHRTYNWRPRVADIEQKLTQARAELQKYREL
ncbi:MAG TPA: hypothetical protein VHZ75_10125 [Solirubrobacteraceae bacterium]|jgi:hypothetical protein|nr:hypothetical protein [Solirubrobacteraceae bacterium]